MIDGERDESSDGRWQRLPRTLLRIGVVVVFAGGTLVACGDDDSAGEDSSDTGGDEVDVTSIEDFCSSMERVNVQLDQSGNFEDSEGSEVAPALEAVGNIARPEEIASEWATLIDATEQAAELEATDGEDFEGTAQTEAAAERILSYVDVQCSVNLSSEPY